MDKACAQHYSWEEFVEKISMDEGEEGSGMNPVLEDLAELHEHPFNINAVTKEELERLPFLNDGEIEEVLAYIYRYGPLKSLGELMLIKALDYQTRGFLSLFVYVGNAEENEEKNTLKSLLKNGRHDVSTRLDIPLYKRDGYKIPDDEVLLKNPNKIYLGNSLYHNIRYAYNSANKLYWGLTMEKDAGEPFGHYGNKGYDSYSFHFMLRDCGKLKLLALGDYRIRTGEGLVVNSDNFFSKSLSFNMGSEKPAVRRFSSVSETSFFRGIAATWRFGRTDVSAFYSFLPVDATLRKDGTISSLKTDGLHRTLLELQKKHNVKEQTTGADVTWSGRYFSLGMTALYQHFDRTFSRGEELYRLYYPQGKDFVNASIHYRWHGYRLMFSGETAFSNVHQGWATLNKAVFRFNHQYSLVALQRLFAYQYVGLRASAFSEGGTVGNESGFYAGIEADPVSELHLSAYVDYFYFPWVKYATPHVSEGMDAALQADWNVGSKWDLSGQYRLKRKERYGNPYLYHKLKIQSLYMPSGYWELRVTGRYTRVRDMYGFHVRGYMAGSTVRWKEKRGKVNLALSCMYFNSEDYKAPMSFYEPSLLYAFSYQTMYGRGIRTAVTARWDISARWMCMVKYGLTAYFDRDEIGEGLQRIDGYGKNDLSFLLRYKI